MKVYLTNAFSINMIQEDVKINFRKITSGTAKQILEDGDFIQAIGHPDTTAIVSSVLGIKLEPNRVTIEFHPTDWLIVAQYRGPRLQPGTTELPENASIEFWLVRIIAQ